jgi:hypothetical protein
MRRPSPKWPAEPRSDAPFGAYGVLTSLPAWSDRLALPMRTGAFGSGRDGLSSTRIPSGTKVTSTFSDPARKADWSAALSGNSK